MKKYRFTSDSPDYRPIKVEPFVENKLPWWCTGYSADMKDAIIVAYLPNDVDIKSLWPEAKNITSQDADEVKYTGRFPKPDWCK